MDGNEEFMKSTQLYKKAYPTTGLLDDKYKMYSSENILTLAIAKAIEPTLSAMDRDQEEVSSIVKLLKYSESPVTTSKFRQTFNIVIGEIEDIEGIGLSTYPTIDVSTQALIFKYGLQNSKVRSTLPKARLLSAIKMAGNQIPSTIDIVTLTNLFETSGAHGVTSVLAYYNVDGLTMQVILRALITMSITNDGDRYLADASVYSTLNAVVKLDDEQIRSFFPTFAETVASSVDIMMFRNIAYVLVLCLGYYGLAIKNMSYSWKVRYSDYVRDIAKQIEKDWRAIDKFSFE